MLTVSFTGHRPNKLNGFDIPNPIYNFVCQEIVKALKEIRPDKVISGMALGVDQWAAFVAYKLGIPFVAAIPFENQECKWPSKSQEIYRKLRKLASEEVIVSPGGYTAAKMQIRNQWMCDKADKLIAVYNGDKFGGTFNCVQYAISINKDIYYINPKDAPNE